MTISAHGVRWLALITLLVALVPLYAPRPALAADATVSTCTEAGFSTALTTVQASGGGTITFDCTGTIVFSGAQTITTNVTLRGNGGVVFDGNGTTWFFTVASTGHLTLEYLTLQNGNNAFDGGAIDNDGGLLTVNASTFSDNDARLGGAIFSSGTATITASTFSGNQAGSGGAIYSSTGPLEVTASTITGNSASANGGAIFNYFGGTVTITGSTVSGNQAGTGSGGGIANAANAGTITATASIIANNTAGSSGPNCNIVIGALVSGGYNLSDEGSCGFTATGDMQNSASVNLGPLADNGGPTNTMLPQSGSAALDAAACSLTSAVDQRGADRPDPPATSCDIGAVEVGATVPVQIVDTFGTNASLDEGSIASVQAGAYGPAGSLVYDFDCNNSGDYETPGNGNMGECFFPDDGSFTVGVQVCDAGDSGNCDTSSADVTVNNLPPDINNITTNGPVAQGQPVTVTVDASDPAGLNDPLTYAFDCDDDGTFEVGPQAGNATSCALDPAAATAVIGVRVSDDDLGVATDAVEVGQTLTLCGNYWTGALTLPGAGGACATGRMPLELPSAVPTTLCIPVYGSGLSWTPSGVCGGNQWTHVVPSSGPLPFCGDFWTGALRHSFSGQCTANELAGVIPG